MLHLLPCFSLLLPFFFYLPVLSTPPLSKRSSPEWTAGLEEPLVWQVDHLIAPGRPFTSSSRTCNIVMTFIMWKVSIIHSLSIPRIGIGLTVHTLISNLFTFKVFVLFPLQLK